MQIPENNYTQSDIALTLAKAERSVVLEVILYSIKLLESEYDFKLHHYDPVHGLVFQNNTYLQERELAHPFLFNHVIDLDFLEYLALHETGFSINGTILFSSDANRINLNIIFYPTFDPENPACVVFLLESILYSNIWNNDHCFDKEAVRMLENICITLGVNDYTNGFRAGLIGDLSEVIPFDAYALTRSLIHPKTILDCIDRPSMRHGFISGIESKFLTLEQLRAVWRDSNIFHTSNRFTIISNLVKLD